MPLTIDIVTPERKVFSSAADSVVLPGLSGEVGMLPGHIPLVTMLTPGKVVVTNGTIVEELVIDKGFARVLDDVASILTEAAIDTDDIDLDSVEEAEARAKAAIEAAKTSKDIDEAELAKMEQILRFSAAQKLFKSPRH